jgi:hypothetical protein
MKQHRPLTWLSFLLPALLMIGARAEEIAVVKENHVNVRGQASLFGEVITQLKMGEQVTILEEITVPKSNAKSKSKSKPDEPSKWARIRMPANTPVWVFASFIDPANKTVKVARINLRAGPGENFSVVGRLERGDTIQDIRTMDQWMEIESPAGAYAFVASEFLAKTSTNSAVANLEKSTPAPNIPKLESAPAGNLPTPPTVVRNAPPETALVPAAEVAATVPKTVVIPPAPAETISVATNTAPIQPPPVVELPPLTVTLPTNTPSPVVTPPTAVLERPPKRIVRREGLVRGTRSIQAPTYFELVNLETGKIINYLHTDDPALKLNSFRGKKIVVVGEEGIDPRWPNTPLIEIQAIDLAP